MRHGRSLIPGLLISSLLAAGAPSPAHSGLPTIATAYESGGAHSPLWFTADESGFRDLRFPSPERRQLEELEILVTDGRGFASELRRDVTVTVRQENEGMAVVTSGTESAGRFRFDQELITDPAAPVLRIRTRLRELGPTFRVFIRLKPAIDGSRGANIGESGPFGFLVTAMGASAPYLALMADAPWKATSAAYSGATAGDREGWMPPVLPRVDTTKSAGPGELTLMGELVRPEGPDFSFELALALGPSARASTTFAQTTLATDSFDTTRAQYEAGWRAYLDSLPQAGVRGPRFVRESLPARRAAQLLKMRESKLSRGMFLPDAIWSAEEKESHFSSAEATYTAALGLLAAGDEGTPEHSLTYLLSTSKTESCTDAALAILLAERLQTVAGRRFGRTERESLRELTRTLLLLGPTWSGAGRPAVARGDSGPYDVTDLARKISALRAASRILGDPAPALMAEQWISQIERWTWIRNDSGMGGRYASSYAPDGFLELVRLRIREARDPRIVSSLASVTVPDGSPPAAAELARRGAYSLMAADPDAALAQMHRLESAGETGIEALAGDLVLHRSIEEREAFDSPMPFPREPARLAEEATVPWSNSSRGTSRSHAP